MGFLATALAAVLSTGCAPQPPPPDPKTREVADASDTIATLRREIAALQRELADAEDTESAQVELRDRMEELEAEVARLKADKKRILEAQKIDTKEFAVSKIALGILTSAVDLDKRKGDDAVQAYLYLIDASGDPVKRAGTVRLELYDLKAENKTKIIIDQWELGADDLARSWSQFLSVYAFRLEWHGRCPSGGDYVLKAVFTDHSGRDFYTRRDLDITPPVETRKEG